MLGLYLLALLAFLEDCFTDRIYLTMILVCFVYIIVVVKVELVIENKKDPAIFRFKRDIGSVIFVIIFSVLGALSNFQVFVVLNIIAVIGLSVYCLILRYKRRHQNKKVRAVEKKTLRRYPDDQYFKIRIRKELVDFVSDYSKRADVGCLIEAIMRQETKREFVRKSEYFYKDNSEYAKEPFEIGFDKQTLKYLDILTNKERYINDLLGYYKAKSELRALRHKKRP